MENSNYYQSVWLWSSSTVQFGLFSWNLLWPFHLQYECLWFNVFFFTTVAYHTNHCSCSTCQVTLPEDSGIWQQGLQQGLGVSDKGGLYLDCLPHMYQPYHWAIRFDCHAQEKCSQSTAHLLSNYSSSAGEVAYLLAEAHRASKACWDDWQQGRGKGEEEFTLIFRHSNCWNEENSSCWFAQHSSYYCGDC